MRSDFSPSRDDSHAGGGVRFLLDRLHSLLNFQLYFSSLDPYSDYVVVNISLKNSFLFLNRLCFFYLLFIGGCRTDFFSPTVLPTSRNLFILGRLKRFCRPSWRREKKYLIGSFYLISFPLITLTSLIFFIVPRVVALLPTSPTPPFLHVKGVALPNFDFFSSHDLVIWTDDSAPFPFGKTGSGVLVNCLLCCAAPPLPFWLTQFVQAILLRVAPFGKLFDGLGSTKKSAISRLFSTSPTLALSSSHYPHFVLFFHFKDFGTSGRNCLLSFPLLSGYNRFLTIHFFRE